MEHETKGSEDVEYKKGSYKKGQTFKFSPKYINTGPVRTFETGATRNTDKSTAEERKGIPVYSGFIKYFPRAILAVARLSQVANEQHNPGEPLHWAKEKSTDDPDAMMRHLIDDVLGDELDTDDQMHLTKVAWRAMANLERRLEENK